MNSKGGIMKLKTAIKNVKLILILLPFAFLLFTLSGCALVKEGAKGVAGISTKVLEDNRALAIIKTFNQDYFSCYTQALDALKSSYTYIYAQDIKKHMIAAYISEYDTTPVGLFFKEIDANNTQIEVSSPSTYAKEFIADNVTSVLEKKVTLRELEERGRAKKQREEKAQEELANQ